nr:hypothetical protein CFP56_42262 [Quercus suber]
MRVKKLQEFAQKNRVWTVYGKPQVGDLIVYPRRAILPMVFRVFHRSYQYIGPVLLAESVSPLKDYYRQRSQQSEVDAFRRITEEFLKILPDSISSDNNDLLAGEEGFDMRMPVMMEVDSDVDHDVDNGNDDDVAAVGESQEDGSGDEPM